MIYKVFIEKKSLKQIKGIPEQDKERIKDALRKLENFPSNLDVKKLVGTKNKYRIRVGNYRILIELEHDQIIVFGVLPRKRAYN